MKSFRHPGIILAAAVCIATPTNAGWVTRRCTHIHTGSKSGEPYCFDVFRCFSIVFSTFFNLSCSRVPFLIMCALLSENVKPEGNIIHGFEILSFPAPLITLLNGDDADARVPSKVNNINLEKVCADVYFQLTRDFSWTNFRVFPPSIVYFQSHLNFTFKEIISKT